MVWDAEEEEARSRAALLGVPMADETDSSSEDDSPAAEARREAEERRTDAANARADRECVRRQAAQLGAARVGAGAAVEARAALSRAAVRDYERAAAGGEGIDERRAERARREAEAAEARAQAQAFAAAREERLREEAAAAALRAGKAWDAHEEAWEALPARAPARALADIPWPPVEAQRLLAPMVAARRRRYARPTRLAAQGDEDRVWREAYRAAMQRWHPDKFTARFELRGAAISEEDAGAAMERCKDIAQRLTAEWAQRTA